MWNIPVNTWQTANLFALTPISVILNTYPKTICGAAEKMPLFTVHKLPHRKYSIHDMHLL